MEKSDRSVKNICIATIKRSTIPPFDFRYTNVYEGEGGGTLPIEESLHLEGGEELICSTIIDDKIWSILTTRRIVSFEGVGIRQHSIANIKAWDFGDFKGYSDQSYTKGFLHFVDDTIVPVFVETGRASMVMIYGVMTIYKQLKHPDI